MRVELERPPVRRLRLVGMPLDRGDPTEDVLRVLGTRLPLQQAVDLTPRPLQVLRLDARPRQVDAGDRQILVGANRLLELADRLLEAALRKERRPAVVVRVRPLPRGDVAE
jgi:hypothetical protein